MTHKWKGTQPPWLSGKNRRTLKNIRRFVQPGAIYELVTKGKGWNYKTQPDYYRKRDQAFLSLMFVSGLRVSEVVRIRKDQFDFDYSERFIIVRDVEISKRKVKTIKAKGIPKVDVWLPLDGELEPFTELVLGYYRICETERLFPFGSGRGLVITNTMTGKWNHYFRSQRISDMINRQKIKVESTAKILGVENIQTISHYDKGTPEEHQEELLK